jgi:preprotein translocase subunit SecG
MKDKFFNFMIVLWIICLIALAIVASLAQKEITEQRCHDMEKGTKSTNR